MKKHLVAAMAMASSTAISVVALGQPFETCEDARNYGKNTSEVTVGQVMARVACDASLLPNAEKALAAAMKDLAATWTGSRAMKQCYFEGLYENAIDRLRRDFARCPMAPAFQAPSLEAVSRIAMATFTALARTEPSLRREADVRAVFDIDHSFLEHGELPACTARVEAVEKEVLETEEARLTWLLDVVEEEICSPRLESSAGGR